MRRKKLLFYILLIVSVSKGAALTDSIKLSEFASPSMRWRPVPLWFWNNTEVKEDSLLVQLDSILTKDCYGGCAILPFGKSFGPAYLSKEYFRLYGKVIKAIKQRGAKMSLYDEYGFPSGSMGAINGSGETIFKNNHPGKTIRRLDKVEYATISDTLFHCELNVKGTIMSVVAMEMQTKKIVSLREKLVGNILTWNVPPKENGKLWLLYV